MQSLTQTERGSGKLLAAPLALLCSAGSITVAVLVGWQGYSALSSDRIVNASINFIGALAAQLLPAIGARQTGLLRAGCVAAWLVCFGWTARGQELYILEAQDRAGQARADAVRLSQTLPAVPARQLPAILNDKAEVTGQLARLPTLACSTIACSDRQRFRTEALTERLAALDAEAQLVVAFGQAQRRQEEQRRQARQDVVGIRMSIALGVSYTAVTSAMALTVALILEGVACLCWAIICKPEPPIPAAVRLPSDGTTEAGAQEAVTATDNRRSLVSLVPDVTSAKSAVTEEQGHDSPVADELAVTSTSHDSSSSASRRARDFANDVARVTAAVLDSTIPLNVIPVRDLLGCGQGHARKVRDFVVKRLNQSPVIDT